MTGSTEWVDTIPTGEFCAFTIWLTNNDFNGNKLLSSETTATIWLREKTRLNRYLIFVMLTFSIYHSVFYSFKNN